MHNIQGGAVFCSYGAFNCKLDSLMFFTESGLCKVTYGALYLPAFGVLEAYTVDGELSPQFGQAVCLFESSLL